MGRAHWRRGRAGAGEVRAGDVRGGWGNRARARGGAKVRVGEPARDEPRRGESDRGGDVFHAGVSLAGVFAAERVETEDCERAVGEEAEEATVVDAAGDRVPVGLDIYGIFARVIDDVGVRANRSGDAPGHIGARGASIHRRHVEQHQQRREETRSGRRRRALRRRIGV